MFSASQALLKNLAQRGALLRSQIRAQRFSTRTDPVRGGDRGSPIDREPGPPIPPESPGWFDRFDLSFAPGGGPPWGPQVSVWFAFGFINRQSRITLTIHKTNT